MTEHSDFLKIILPGDLVPTDKGFCITDSTDFTVGSLKFLLLLWV